MAPVTVHGFRSFSFNIRFDKQRIVAVSRDEQLRRSLEFFRRLGEIHPLMKSWYLQASSPKEALKRNVVEEPKALLEAVEANHDPSSPWRVVYSVWNGEQDPRKGGIAFHYKAHDSSALSCMRFENAGAFVMALPQVRSVFIDMISAAVSLWPEIDWATVAPEAYYLERKVFKDRQTIGWIGFCPHTVKRESFPEAFEIIPIPGHGSVIVTCADVMDINNPTHLNCAGETDIKLVELGLLPMYNN